jgi:hypothetical protein
MLFESVRTAKDAAASLSTSAALTALATELAQEAPRSGVLSALVEVHLSEIVATALNLSPAVLPALDPVAAVHLGTLSCPRGQIVVADTGVIDEKWVPSSTSAAKKGFVVDIIGEQAEYLAHRNSRYKNHQVGPDYWRVTMNNTIEANAVADEHKRLVAREAWNTRVIIHSSGSTHLLATDIARIPGAGVSTQAGLDVAALDVLPGARVPVHGVKDESGRIVKIIIG